MGLQRRLQVPSACDGHEQHHAGSGGQLYTFLASLRGRPAEYGQNLTKKLRHICCVVLVRLIGIHQTAVMIDGISLRKILFESFRMLVRFSRFLFTS
jgi:hypothetical protein